MSMLTRALLPLALAFAVAACETPQAPSPMAAPRAETSVVLRTNFAFNSWALSPAALGEISALADALNNDPRLQGATQVDVNGHTDIVGRLGYNMGLSMLRAGAVVDALTARGVAQGRLRPQGFGPLQLLDPANPRSGVNRRVEVVAFY
jgi:outer membrane protein OmpA-like peptidoglycan-associated protein